jgi:hypothetical protein
MPAKMIVDLSEKIRKGDAPPKGQEARYVRAGLAKEVDAAPAAAAAPAPAKTAAPRKKAKAKK